MLKIGWPNASRPRLGLALPFGDVRKRHLERIFAVKMILTIIAIGSSNTREDCLWRDLPHSHAWGGGVPVYKVRFDCLEKRAQEMAKQRPGKLKLDELHAEHELVLLDYRYSYDCNACMEMGMSWCFFCDISVIFMSIQSLLCIKNEISKMIWSKRQCWKDMCGNI